MLFKSGFEDNVTLSGSDSDEYQYFVGTDKTFGFTWPPIVGGSSGSGVHNILNDNGAAIDNEIQTVKGHTGALTKAWFNRMNHNVSVTQSPYQLNNWTKRVDKFYAKYWMKIDNTSMVGSGAWRALWEYKTFGYGAGNGFRMIAYIYTNKAGVPYWHFQGDTDPSSGGVWDVDNYTIPVPLNKWFSVEYYFDFKITGKGRAWWKVNGQMVADVTDVTTAKSKDIEFMILTQIYGNRQPMHQWIDDIEIWDDVPYVQK